MTHPNFMILYVDSPEASSRFYTDLLGVDPVETSPTFALFALKTGLMLGLWSRHTVEPSPDGTKGACELAFAVNSYDDVDATFADWSTRRISVLQQPKTMEFGRSFMAADLDGHRLRVFAPEDQQEENA